ncbi:hypothetical protein JW964_28275, partial [candidate division KSB1 bacterium]|nr:hypothetical protein [candidate division KSB1 bacterium]
MSRQKTTKSTTDVKRREFLALGAVAGLGAAIGSMGIAGCGNKYPISGEAFTQFKVPPVDPVRIGFVGVGGMGSVHV